MKALFILICFSVCNSFFGQTETDFQLATYYMNSKDYEKALPYFDKIFKKDPSSANFQKLYTCFVETKDNINAEKLLKSRISKNENDPSLKIQLGQFYETTNRSKDAKKVYEKLIDEIPMFGDAVIEQYRGFLKINKDDFALKTLERGRKKLQGFPLNLQFGEYFLAHNEIEKGINEYLDLLEENVNYSNIVQQELMSKIDFSNEQDQANLLLKERLLEINQKKPNDFVYSELLIWYFIQRKNFDGAVSQGISINKRVSGDGKFVYNLATVCQNNKAFREARRAFRYVIEIGQEQPYYLQSELGFLNTRFEELTAKKNYTESELLETVSEYKLALQRLGVSSRTVKLQLELAHVMTFYANKSAEAITLLEETLKIAGISQFEMAQTKIALADAYVVNDDIWTGSIYYQQVEKEYKFDVIGFEAKYKNARIFYYDGDFKWAQTQLDVLKNSTSKLISNDAMRLSILITDNLGLDSNLTAMTQFAKADLLVEQRRYAEAFQLLDSISKFFPAHGLNDEVLMKRADAFIQQGQWENAIKSLNQIVEFHTQDILADDALFMLGDIYEMQLGDVEKAQVCYKRILFEYSGSLHVVEARKRYRFLRGDKVDDL